MSHVSLYHAALKKAADDPLMLTAADFDLFLEFGGPHEVKRVRETVDKYIAQQLGVVKETSTPIEVKAPAAPAAPHPWRRDPILLDKIAEAIVFIAKRVKLDVDARLLEIELKQSSLAGQLHALETRVADLGGELKQVAATVEQSRPFRRSA